MYCGLVFKTDVYYATTYDERGLLHAMAYARLYRPTETNPPTLVPVPRASFARGDRRHSDPPWLGSEGGRRSHARLGSFGVVVRFWPPNSSLNDDDKIHTTAKAFHSSLGPAVARFGSISISVSAMRS